MTWHVVGNQRGIRRVSTGVRVAITRRRDKKHDGNEFIRTEMEITIYNDVLQHLDYKQDTPLVLEVGADHDAGIIKIRPAVEGEDGLRMRRSRANGRLFIAMMRFPLPPINPQPTQVVHTLKIDNRKTLTLVLPGPIARDLRAAQSAALLAAKEGMK